MRIPLPDCPPPHAAHARLAARSSTSFLLESRDGPRRLARYSFLGFAPVGTVRLDHEGLAVTGALPAPLRDQAPLDYLRRVQAFYGTDDHATPFVGGLVGAVGYDFARTLEPRLEHQAQEAWPRLLFGVYVDGIVYDHVEGTAHYVTRGEDRSAEVLDALRSPVPEADLRVGLVASAVDGETFQRSVQRAQELIRAGEAFQVVLSRAFHGGFEGSLSPLYAWLAEQAPVPYLYHLRFGDLQLVGASPECLVRVRRGVAETFPIAGTRPVTGDAATDAAAAEELAADRKETAEHAMLVDLARNDLGRVCTPGTVEVAAYQETQRFRDVMHLVSRVHGRLAPGHDAWAALAAVFPAGTVSGAPKLRAMEHIDALEDVASHPRGPYAGAVCYASFNGDFDSAITIRTMSTRGSRLTVQAGAGIVHRSRPEAEWQETAHKARTLLSALRHFGATGGDLEAAIAAGARGRTPEAAGEDRTTRDSVATRRPGRAGRDRPDTDVEVAP